MKISLILVSFFLNLSFPFPNSLVDDSRNTGFASAEDLPQLNNAISTISVNLSTTNHSLDSIGPRDRTLNSSHISRTKNSHEKVSHESLKAEVAAGFLFAHRVDTQLDIRDSIDATLLDILKRNGPDMRPSRDFKDFKDITLEISKRAWELLHEHVVSYVKDKTRLTWPAIEQLLRETAVSNKCLEALQFTFEQAGMMRSWAIKMLNSWGSFPMSGLFEGTYSDVGAFHACIDISGQPEPVDHAHYCSVSFRPVLPSRKDYDVIVRHEPQELVNLFEEHQQESPSHGQGGRDSNSVMPSHDFTTTSPSGIQNPVLSPRDRGRFRNALSDIMQHAQYHHFVYYKWGTCWPITCSPVDVRLLAKQIAKRNMLMNGPVKCYSKNDTDYQEEFSESEIFGRSNGSLFDPTYRKHNPHDVAIANTTVKDPRSEVRARHGSPDASNDKDNSGSSAKRKLELSVWDKNEGIFIWKPHFYRPQKIALGIILAVSLFILSMSLIDLFINRAPIIWAHLRICSRDKPVNQNNLSTELCQNRRIIVLDEDLEVSLGDGILSNQPPYLVKNQESAMPISDQRKEQLESNGSSPTTVWRSSSCKNRHQSEHSLFMDIVNDCSLFTNVPQFFRVSEGQLRNDILCLNGIRCITMIWIIMTHTMMYNDWSAFARTKEIEISLNSLISQPLFNGSYLVDTFFLMSGLLSSFTAFKHCQGMATKFNSFAYIFGRWLRLTPQIFFVSMIYIIFPSISYGPHWFPYVGEHSENCINNWWINVLHLQSFYKKEEMCNFVTWWISIDFFYHFLALVVIWIILFAGHRHGLLSLGSLVGAQILWQSFRHYQLELPPNILSTIPQTGAMWTTMTLGFFWTPYTHSVPFFSGFYIGYLMALKKHLIVRNLSSRRALVAWALSIGLLVGQSYSTYWWVTGKATYSPLVSTLFYGICSIIWSSSLCWIIIACQYGYGGFINDILSCRVFIVLGKASYLVYLTHFHVLFIYYGNQNLLLEPTTVVIFYAIIGNIFLSTIWGIFLCSIFELPWLKAQRRLMKYV